MTDDHHGFSLIEVLVALAMVGVLAAVVTLPLKQEDERQYYEKTLATMDEIREAVLGRPGLYCNGQRQFTGYVSDMGDLPLLVDGKGEEVGDLVLEQHGEPILLFPQPRALWTRDMNGDGDTDDPEDIPEDFCWKYYEEKRIWAGWRGPYIQPPTDDILKDGWGNPLLFSEGEIITLKDETVVEYTATSYTDWLGNTTWRWEPFPPVEPGTYRCKKDWAFPPGPDSDSRIKNPLPGFEDPYHSHWEDCWEALPEAVAPPVIIPGENYGTRQDTYRNITTNLYYGEGTLSVVSYGSDGAPGGEGYNQDIVMTIYRNEWTGEVAGMIGNSQEDYANNVSICFPRFEPGRGDLVQWSEEIPISFPSRETGKNFYFGSAPLVEEQRVLGEDGSRLEINVPMGIRSIKIRSSGHEDRIYVFSIEPTGNFIGTLRPD